VSEFYILMFQNTCLFHLRRRCKLTPPTKMQQCSEMSAHKIQAPGNHPKGRVQQGIIKMMRGTNLMQQL